MKTKSILSLAVSAVVATLAQSNVANAQDTMMLEEVIVTGTRSQKARTVADSPVPVDVLNSEEFNSFGNNADITDNLKSLIPSYTAIPATGDGSAFIRPTAFEAWRQTRRWFWLMASDVTVRPW